ncbi:hypothetical protein ACO0SA_001650 [Hanseniaspora valbyensis]
MSETNSIGEDFAITDIPFYTNLTSIFHNSIYTFSSIESMELFKKSGNKMDKPGAVQRQTNFQYIGIPLFQCQLKKDPSFLLKRERSNLIIYKYIILPIDENNGERQQMMAEHLDNREYKFICNNEEHNISIYKVVFSEIKNEMALLSLSTHRKYTLKFRNDNILMTFKSYDDYVEVDNSLFQNAKWIYHDNVGDILRNDFYVDDNYKLMLQDESIVSEFDNTERSNKWTTDTLNEFMGLLKVANNIKPPAFSSNEKIQYHDNNFLNDFNEKIICMTFVLITHRKYEDDSKIITKRRNKRRNRIGLKLLSGESISL